ncbi:HD domain-containing protein [Bacillus tianshenii]|uniref:HD domain-containing protein n=1 Tax=Sutcliffiella tianshenii TaxID=1463404 RepID=UPI001CD1AFED|nr:HD domain-containing protein [Bacillus tianshenii]MCA1321149.1 HD domain-containing protein [Bacillus tianshenii]
MDKIESFVQAKFEHDATGHDWHHIQRVRKLAVHIAEQEKADRDFVEIIALLHDVIDDKLTVNTEEALNELTEFLKGLAVSEEQIHEIMYIIDNIGFKGGNGIVLPSLEGRIVQDADRLDALGAIGIARTFMYAGAKGSAMYDPRIEVRDSMSYEQYRTERSSAINHFYEKLFLLKDTLHTNTAKRIADERHVYMEQFVDQFLKEWNEI